MFSLFSSIVSSFSIIKLLPLKTAPSFIDKIESIKLVLIDESFGYIQCISNCELYDSQLSILSIFFHNEYIIINQLLSPVSNSGSEINTTDEIAFDEYLMDANKAIKDAFKNIKLYYH